MKPSRYIDDPKPRKFPGVIKKPQGNESQQATKKLKSISKGQVIKYAPLGRTPNKREKSSILPKLKIVYKIQNY